LAAGTGRAAGPGLVNAIVGDLRQLGEDTRPPRPRVDVLTRALVALSEQAAGQPAAVQDALLARIAADQGLDAAGLAVAAVDVGGLIARSTHRPSAYVEGRRALNALAGANIPLAVETQLARQGLATLARRSSPDLPRLWILANGLTHGVSAT